jgi:hypothetical protein
VMGKAEIEGVKERDMPRLGKEVVWSKGIFARTLRVES